MFKRTGFPPPEGTSPSLVVTTFQASIDNLLLEATKNRTMNPLRDAAHSARGNGFIAEDVFHTLVLACDTLHNRREYRALLMRSLSDLGKMAFLGLLPITSTVVHVVCDLVRKLLRSNTAGNPMRGYLPSGFTRKNSNAVVSPGASLNLEGNVGNDQSDVELTFSSLHGLDAAEHAPAEDEELQMRILQTLIAFLSACAFDNEALSDIIGLLFTIYILAVPESKVEVTCAATIEQQTLELLRSFCYRSTVDDEGSLSLQFQCAAYMKDVCIVCSGDAPKWLRLGSQSQQQQQQQQNQQHLHGNTITPPRRLRLLLLHTLVTHMTEIEPISSPQEMNIFFSQLLNDDVVSLALLHSAPHRNEGHSVLIDLLRREGPLDGEEEFHLTQKLVVTALTKALPTMRHTAPTVLLHHAMLVKLSAEGDGGEEDARRMAILLALWRKAIADHEVMRQLLLLQHSANASAEEMHEVSEPANSDTDAVWLGGAENAFVGLIAAAARLLASISTASDGTAETEPQGTGKGKGKGGHPAAGQAGGVLAFLTMCAQGFARVAVELSSTPVTESKAQSAISEVRTVFVALHPLLHRCYALAAQCFPKDDVIHITLKGIVHLVQTACVLGLPTQRDGYLQIFSSEIFISESEEQLQRFCPQQQQQQQQRDCDEGSSSRSSISSALRSRHVGEPREDRALTIHRILAASLTHQQPDTLQQQQQQQQQKQQQLQQLRCRVDFLQKKLHVLNSIISIANSLGHILGDGWGSVASCLLAAESLLLRYRGAVEDYAAACQHSTARQQSQEEALRTVEHLRNSLHLLFINSAIAPDEAGIHGLLVHYVAEAIAHVPTVTVESLATFRAAGECCALGLVSAAAAACNSSSVDRLLRLWSAARPFFAHAFDAVTLQRFLLPPAADGFAVLARLLEDVAVVMAQFCHPGLSTGGPYASAVLLVRLAALSTSTGGDASAVSKDRAHSLEGDGAYQWRQLLASPAELFAEAYDQLLQAAALEGSLVLLREVRRLVQCVGEELQGEAWIYLLGLLRRAATVSEEESNEKKEEGAAPVGELVSDEDVTAYRSPSKAESSGGNTSPGGAVGAAKNAPEPPTPSLPLQSLADGATGVETTNYAKQSVSIAFRALETIQHSCITSLDDEGIRQLIRCGGAFMTHSIRDGETRLNINLSAVQLLWSVADFIVLREEARRTAEGAEAETNACDDLLWCTLLLQLYDGCLDVRPEVRQSALKTLFSLVQTYGARLSADSWNCILRNIIVPLVDEVLEAAVACATRGDVEETPRRTQSFWYSNASSPEASSRDESLPVPFGVKGRHAAALQAHFAAFPVFFDEMRVTLMDSACRVFATHHSAMRLALQQPQREEQQSRDLSLAELNERVELMHVAIGAFIGLCATSRLVARGTNGEATALSAIRALRALAVEAEGLLAPEEMNSAWRAVERLFLSDAAESPSSGVRVECTTPVTVAVVSTLSEFAAAMRWVSPSDTPLMLSSLNAQTRDASEVSGTSFFQQLRRALTAPGVPDVLWTSHNQQQQQQQDLLQHQEQQQKCYIARFLRVVQEALRSPAATESYFFPCHVQVAVMESWRNLWPILDAHEREAVLELALQQFPTLHAVQSFLAQGAAVDPDSSATTSRAPPLSLQLFFPRGAHPTFLVALMGFLRAAGGEVDATARRMAPGAVRAAGALLLLEYADPQLLAARGPGAPFTPAPECFAAAEECLEYFLSRVVGAAGPVESEAQSALRRAGLAAGAEMCVALVGHADTTLREMADRPMGGGTQEQLSRAIGRLEGIVRLLGELIARVLRVSGDVDAAAELLAALVPASVVDAPLFAGVARLSFEVLRRWTVKEPAGIGKEETVGEDEKKEKEMLRNREEHAEQEPLCRQLQHVARMSIHARNREVLQRFMENSSSHEARQMTKKTLQAMILLYPAKVYGTDGTGEGQESEEEAEENDEFEMMQKVMVDLVRVVECTGDDADLRLLLSRAMMTVCVSLGFSGAA